MLKVNTRSSHNEKTGSSPSERLKVCVEILPSLNIIAVCFGILVLTNLNSFAGKMTNVFKKYSYDSHHNANLYDTVEGYVFKYCQIVAIPSHWNKRRKANPGKYLNCFSYIDRKFENINDNVIIFRYTSRLYPVDPATELLKNKFKLKFTAASLSANSNKPKFHLFINAYIDWPYFVLSKEPTSKDYFQVAFPRKGFSFSESKTYCSRKFMQELYVDHRVSSNDLFEINEHKIVVDVKKRVMLHSRNGYKELYYLRKAFPELHYCSFRTNFLPVEKNGKKVIALEEEIIPTLISRKNTGPLTDNYTYSLRAVNYYEKRLKDDRNDIDAAYMLGRCYYDGVGTDKDYYEAAKWFYKAARKKHVFAQYYLGLVYYFGHGVEQDDKKAMAWLRKASEYFYSNAMVLETHCMMKNAGKNYSIYQRLSNQLIPARYQGNANAFFLNAMCEQKNKKNMRMGSKFCGGFQAAAARNHPKALYYCAMDSTNPAWRVKYLKRSAKFGYVPALVKLGDAYREGRGGRQSDKDAFRCYKEAADSGNMRAKYFLALAYYLGHGVKADREQALSLLGEAAENGVPKAMIALVLVGGKKTDETAEDFFNGREKEAVKHWQETNTSQAKFCVALAIKYGIGCKKSKPVAAFRQLLNSLNGSLFAFLEIAEAYEKGEGTVPNRFNAVKMYEKAAQAGSTIAMLQLSRLLAVSNTNQSVKWLQLGTQKGNTAAAYQLGMIYFNKGKTQMAFKAFKTAAKKEHIRALYMLGDCYYKGIGVKKDKKMAGECWKKYEEALYRQENNSLEGPWWGSLPTYPIEGKVINESVKRYLAKY